MGGMGLLFTNLPLLLICLLCRLCGATEYYVRPTQPSTTSCPGQPCHTLAQYISDSDYYFKSNNNTVFWLLSGTHNISMPVIIRDAHNVSLKRYGAGVEYPRVVFSPTYYCMCASEASIMGACKECSAIQFCNVSVATVNGLVLVGWSFNKTSSINGLSVDRCDRFTVQNITVVTKQVNPCYLNGTCAVSGLLFSRTSNTSVHNVSADHGRIMFHKTVSTSVQNIALNHAEMFTNITESTEIKSAVITNTYTHGITSRRSKNMIIWHVSITNTLGHCIRLQHVSNMSIFHLNVTQCKGDGILILQGSNTQISNAHFKDNYIHSESAAVVVHTGINTKLKNIIITHFSLYAIVLFEVHNTSIESTAVTGSGIFCYIAFLTSLSDLTVVNATSGIDFSHAIQTNIVNSIFSIDNSDISAVLVSHSANTLLRNVSVTPTISVQYCNQITLDHIELENNTYTSTHAVWVYKSVNVTIANSSFIGINTLIDVTDRPAVVVLYHSSSVKLSKCHFSQNTISSLKTVASHFSVADSLTFTNNTAPTGAAMILQERSVMKLLNNSSLLFTGNHATLVGGAIYVDTNAFYVSKGGGVALSSECIFQTDGKVTGKKLVFENNSAGSGGDVVYGGLMGIATTTDDLSCLKQFKILSQIDQTNTLSAISSQPSRVCICSTRLPDCRIIFYTLPEPVYPGQMVYLPAVVVGQNFGTGTGSVYAQFLNTNGEDRKQDKTLKQWQYTQGVSQDRCNQLTYSILAAPANDSTVLVLSAVKMNEVTQVVSNTTIMAAINEYNHFERGSGKRFPHNLLEFPLYVNISVLPCPPGFTLSQWPYKCECNHHLRQLPGVKCSIQTLTFERSDFTWIGLDGEDGVVVSKYCPYLFCKENRVNVTLDELDVQCNYNHSGQLCGGCKPGLSLALGSNQCLHCSNRFLFLLIPMALAGIVLVFAIKVLDITVSRGYLNGLVFFFNIVHSAWPAFIPQGHNNPLAILVAWTNLDMGIETCFFDGLSAYWKTWLQFVFPLYIWGISGLIIISAKYSKRMSRLMGNNPVPVLGTLFLLSYTKLLRTAIMIMSYSFVVYPNDKRAVWSLDGNIDYLGPKHLPLFAVAVAVLFFLCLPYTLILLLGQWLCQCNNRHISHMMFRIKPFLDAYYGPLKDKHRYWIGLLLFSRTLIYVTQAIIPNKSPSVVVLAVSIMAVGFLQMTGYVTGFYHSRYVSTFEVTILSNLTLYSLVKLYTEQTVSVVDNIFIAAAITQLSGLVLFRGFCVVKQLLPHQFTILLKRFTLKSGEAAVNLEDWETYEEASLMRHTLDDQENPEDRETFPINTNNMPTYGI